MTNQEALKLIAELVTFVNIYDVEPKIFRDTYEYRNAYNVIRDYIYKQEEINSRPKQAL